MLELDVQTLNMLAGLVIPLLVGVVTKKLADSWVKAVTNFALSALSGGLAVAIAADGMVHLRDWIVAMVSTWIVSIATYYGFWKPTGVALQVQDATAMFGIGAEVLEFPPPQQPTKYTRAELRKMTAIDLQNLMLEHRRSIRADDLDRPELIATMFRRQRQSSH